MNNFFSFFAKNKFFFLKTVFLVFIVYNVMIVTLQNQDLQKRINTLEKERSMWSKSGSLENDSKGDKKEEKVKENTEVTYEYSQVLNIFISIFWDTPLNSFLFSLVHNMNLIILFLIFPYQIKKHFFV